MASSWVGLRLPDSRRVVGRRGDTPRGEHNQELAHEERIPGGHLLARAQERRVGRISQGALDQLRNSIAMVGLPGAWGPMG